MELKINESKVLEFNTVIEGGDASDIKGKMRIEINEVEYGIPISFDGGKIQVKIPPLKNIVKEENLRKGKSAFARLDIMAKGKLFTPWSDQVSIEVPLAIKAEMTDIKGFLDEADKILVSKVEEKVEPKVEPVEVKEKKEVKVNEDINKGSKKKSKFFSVMLEQDKTCPEGEKW